MSLKQSKPIKVCPFFNAAIKFSRVRGFIFFKQNVRSDKPENRRVIIKFYVDKFISRVIADQMIAEIRMRVAAGKKRDFFSRGDLVIFLQTFAGRTKYLANVSSG